MQKIITLFRNKYFLAIAIFVVWMTFFDRNDFIIQYEYQSQLEKLEQEKVFYTQQNAIIGQELNELNTNISAAEKFAREKYYMKKDNEDVFVLVDQLDSTKN